MLAEKHMEDLIAAHPDEFLEPGWRLDKRQGYYEGRRIDLVFKDAHNRILLVELKRGVVTREHVGQIVEYYGLLRKRESGVGIELLLIGNNIPHERREFLCQTGIEVNEIPERIFVEVARKYDYPLPTSSTGKAETNSPSNMVAKSSKRSGGIEGPAIKALVLEIWSEMGGSWQAKRGPGYRLDHPSCSKHRGVTFVETKSDYEYFKAFYCLRIGSEDLWYSIYSEIADNFSIKPSPKGPLRAYPARDDRQVLRRFLQLNLEYWAAK
jgi:hypothetical protein